MQRAVRIAFTFCACLAFVMAVLTHPPQIPGEPSDKIKHVLAFATLGGLAAYGWPQVRWVILFAALSVFGAAIELVQAIPVLHRDSEVADLLADMAAAVVALLAVRWAMGRKPSRS